MGQHMQKWCMTLVARHLKCRQQPDVQPYTTSNKEG